MNYRHAFHAGNFADVLKHAGLLAALDRMGAKDKPLCVLDTHAGRGRYELDSAEAARSPEWKDGIARVMAAARAGADLPAAVRRLADAVSALNADALTVYPGSPLLVADRLRPGDRAVFVERQEGEAAALSALMRGRRGVEVRAEDGWAALLSLVPPPERRGLVLIDPPFEDRREFQTLAKRLAQAVRRWPTGVFLVWYPVKDRDAARAFEAAAAQAAPGEIAIAELARDTDPRAAGLASAAVLAVNPPWGWAEEIAAALAWLAAHLGAGAGGGWRFDHRREDGTWDTRATI